MTKGCVTGGGARRRAGFARPLWPVLLALILAGCAPPDARGPQARIGAATGEALIRYAFAADGVSLSAAEQRRIRQRLSGFGLSDQDALVVSLAPAGAAEGLAARRRQNLALLLAAYPAQLRFVTGDEPVPDGSGIIRLVRARSLRVDCSDGAAAAGCASARNLAAQIGTPADLVLPGTGRRYLPPTAAAPEGGLSDGNDLAGAGS